MRLLAIPLSLTAAWFSMPGIATAGQANEEASRFLDSRIRGIGPQPPEAEN